MEKKEKILFIGFIIAIVLIGMIFIVLAIYKDDEKDIDKLPSDIDNSNKIDLNVNDYVTQEDYYLSNIDKSYKKIIFKNIDSNILNEFLIEQREFYDKIESYSNYDSSLNLEVINEYEIDNNILSVSSKIVNDNIIFGIISINIDLENKKLLTDEELLEQYKISIDKVVDDLFINSIYNDKNDNFINKQDNKLISKEEVIENKEDYIQLIKNNVSSVITFSLSDNKLVMYYRIIDIKSIFFNVAQGGIFEYEKEVLK